MLSEKTPVAFIKTLQLILISSLLNKSLAITPEIKLSFLIKLSTLI